MKIPRTLQILADRVGGSAIKISYKNQIGHKLTGWVIADKDYNELLTIEPVHFRISGSKWRAVNRSLRDGIQYCKRLNELKNTILIPGFNGHKIDA